MPPVVSAPTAKDNFVQQAWLAAITPRSIRPLPTGWPGSSPSCCVCHPDRSLDQHRPARCHRRCHDGPVRIDRHHRVRIWLDNKVDFSKPTNQIPAATALIMGIADFTLKAGGLTFAGIALGSIAAIGVYHVMTTISRLRGTDTEAVKEPAPPPTL